jgi:hypothetical protein
MRAVDARGGVGVRGPSVVRSNDGVEGARLHEPAMVREYHSERFYRVAITNRVLTVESHLEPGVVDSG